MQARKMILGAMVVGAVGVVGALVFRLDVFNHQYNSTLKPKHLDLHAIVVTTQDVHFDPKDYNSPIARAVASALLNGPKVYSGALSFSPISPDVPLETAMLNPDSEWAVNLSAEPLLLEVSFDLFSVLERERVFELIEFRKPITVKIKDKSVGEQSTFSKDGKTYLNVKFPILQVTSFDPNSIYTGGYIEPNNGVSCDLPIEVNVSIEAVSELGKYMMKKFDYGSTLRLIGCLSNTNGALKLDRYYIGQPIIREGR